MNKAFKPIILYANRNTQLDLEKLKKKNKVWCIKDIYRSQLIELFNITFPNLKLSSDYSKKLSSFLKSRLNQCNKLQGNWIYFPWNGYLVHTVSKNDYFALRTNRNKNLITKQEQEKIHNLCIGIVGLSVGSSVALGLIYQGIGKHFKLAEFDNLETANLNRVQYGIHQIGNSKLQLLAQKIYEIDPYNSLTLFPEGLNKKNLNDFVNNKPKPNIIFELIDDIEMKIRLRIKAKLTRIPVISFANLGDNILIDIERYDLDKDLPIYNGVIGDLPEKILIDNKIDVNKYAVQIVGKKNIPKRALDSVRQINKTLVGRPQLSSSVIINGALASIITRAIVIKKSTICGRQIISLDKILNIV